MYKSFLKNYAKKITKEDLYFFKNKNGISATDKDINIIYEHIKKYNVVFFDNPIKYISLLKGKISDNVYKEILSYYDKYKNYI